MKVSHSADYATSAVIGASQVQEMGITNSPEFLQILSSSLYTHQVLAFVRETLSNHWDAHIDAGMKDIPIEVTITDTEYVVRDYGKGIHKDVFGTIYGTFGQGTKANDSNSIGGFGLGCKSPHAYTDAFEVISNCDGIKTVYSIVKGSRQADGKHAIITVVEVPTDDSGVVVKVPLKSSADARKVNSLVKALVYLGDINCALNGEVLPTLNMSFDTGTYSILRKDYAWYIDNLANNRVYIRYANVVYPLPAFQADTELLALYQFLETVVTQDSRSYENCIIIQAEPDSLSIQPSREGISLTKHSEDSLLKLLRKAKKRLMHELNTTYKSFEDFYVNYFNTIPFSDLENGLYRVRDWKNDVLIRNAAAAYKESITDTQHWILSYYMQQYSNTAMQKAREIYYSRYLAKNRGRQADIAMLRENGYLQANHFTQIHKKALKALGSVPKKYRKDIKAYAYLDTKVEPISSVCYAALSKYLQCFKREVLIGRTLKDIKEYTDSTREEDIGSLVIRYTNWAAQKALVDLLDKAGITYVDCSDEEEHEKVKSARVSVPVVADYLNGVPVLTSSSYVDNHNKTKNIEAIIVLRKDGCFVSTDGSCISSYIVHELVSKLKGRIGVVPTLTIAKSLTKRWGLVDVNTALYNAYEAELEANKAEWHVTGVTMEQVDNAATSLSKTHNSYGKFRHPLARMYSKLLLEKTFPYQSAKYIDFLKIWKTSCNHMGLPSVKPDFLLKEVNKDVSLDKIPKKLQYQLIAAARYDKWGCFNEEALNDETILQFINQQLRKIENDYKNKGGSRSRNYGYYHPVQGQR